MRHDGRADDRDGQTQDHERDQRSDQAGRKQRHAEHQIEPNRRTDELRQVRGHRHDFGLQPQQSVHPPAEPVPAQLRQALAGGQANLGGEVLDTDGHQVGRHDDPHQLIALLGTAGEVGGEITRIDVGHRGHESRAEYTRCTADPSPSSDIPQRDGPAAARLGSGHGTATP